MPALDRDRLATAQLPAGRTGRAGVTFHRPPLWNKLRLVVLIVLIHDQGTAHGLACDPRLCDRGNDDSISSGSDMGPDRLLAGWALTVSLGV